jgi:hypothetical protein
MNNVIFLNHKEKACGIYQYGLRSGKILKKSKIYNFIYIEVENDDEFASALETHHPIAIIYNYYPATMSWLNYDILKKYPKIIHYGLHHEGNIPNSKFNYILHVDSTQINSNKSYPIPRPLLENNLISTKNTIPVISSFGFGFEHKGFEKIIKLVNDQFESAIIKLHISKSFFGDKTGQRALDISSKCFNEMKNENIRLIITNDFLSNEQMLEFLANSDLNIFLYDNITDFSCGLSSVIDYALSVNVPLAISGSNMFRHIINSNPSICIEDKSLQELINQGLQPIVSYKIKWSNVNFIKEYEKIINETKY